jgi:hypothetical protein
LETLFNFADTLFTNGVVMTLEKLN